MKKWSILFPFLLVLYFIAISSQIITAGFPLEGPTERQGQVAGMIRLYCLDPTKDVLHSPQLPFGRQSFNMEFSIIEWGAGRLLHAVTGDLCNYVEETGKVLAIFFTSLAILTLYLFTKSFFSETAAVLGVLLLFSKWEWLHFSAFIMLDIRMILFGVLSYLALTRSRWIVGALLLFLSATSKPQGFIFVASFLGVFHLIHSKDRKKVLDPKLLGSVAFGLILAAAYFKYSSILNEKNDLPWLGWSGESLTRWIFGPLSERLDPVFYKSLILDLVKRTGLVFTIPAVIVFSFINKAKSIELKTQLSKLFILSLPYISAHIIYHVFFISMIKVHNYYALPLDYFSAITQGIVFAQTILFLGQKSHFAFMAFVAFAIVSAIPVNARWIKYIRDHQDTSSSLFHPDWNLAPFPKKNAFVAIFHPGRGRDYFFHILTKTTGYSWCVKNLQFAPRKFWKENGIEFVAYHDGVDPLTRKTKFIVRTIDEDLAFARSQGWSSDTNDVWALKSMQEWATLASKYELDPCQNTEEQMDPRNWDEIIKLKNSDPQ